MKINKKVTDFITLDDGNIGRKSAVVTGALLASSVLGLVLTAEVAEAQCHTNNHYNSGHSHHANDHQNSHTDGPFC